MGKLAKILILVVLVLSAVSLVLGIMLFSKREIMKGRTQKLELAAADVAGRLHEQIDTEQLKDYARMDGPLKMLAVQAENTYTALQDTKADLDNTQVQLAQAQTALEVAKKELETAEAQVAQIQSEIEAKEVELAQASTRIDQLDQDKQGLQVQIDELNTKLVDAEELTRDLQDQVSTLDQALKRFEDQMGTSPHSLPVGLAGRIMVVNPYWNFVILDLGADDGLSANAEMLVHRDDRLIGKVRISSVEKDVAVAEILTDWEQVPIREGDHVLF